MKIARFWYALGLLFFLIVSGCDIKDDSDKTQQNQVLISHTKLTDFSINTSILDQMLSRYSQFNDSIIQNATQFNVNVYKVIYKTTYNGVEKRASGACIIPESGGAALPIAGYQHGTIFHDNEAPSSFTSIINITVEMGFTLAFSSCGFVLSAPDYIGYNESGDVIHPYHHYESTANACVDMMRAVKELCKELNVNVQEKYFLLGYSEGGYSTLATLKKIQSQYSSQFPITACSAGAGAYDLLNTAVWYMNRSTLANSAFPCFVFVAFNEVYGWNRPMGQLFQSPYGDRIASGLFNGTYTMSQINSQLTNQTQSLFNPTFRGDFLGNGEQTLKNALQENSLYSGWYPQTPTRLYHGSADDIVPPFNSANTQDAFKNAGSSNVQYIPYAGLNHDTAIIPWVKDTILWFKSLSL